jgi:hypothetical protein
MAKIKDMTFSKSVKISRNYNTIGLEYGITIEMEEGDVSSDIKEMGWSTVATQLDEQIVEAMKTLADIQ